MPNFRSFLFSYSPSIWVIVTILFPRIIEAILFPLTLIAVGVITKFSEKLRTKYPGSYVLSVNSMAKVLFITYLSAILFFVGSVGILSKLDADFSFFDTLFFLSHPDNRIFFGFLEMITEIISLAVLILFIIVYRHIMPAIGLTMGQLGTKRLIVINLIGVIGLTMIWLINYFFAGPQIIDKNIEHKPSGLFFVLFFLLWLWDSSGIVVLEEIIYRGIIYSTIKERLGIYPGIIISSLLFSLGHMRSSTDTIIAMFFAGIILALIYERTKSLYPSMLAHGINNFIGLAAIYFTHSQT